MYQIGKMPHSIDIGYIGETNFRQIDIDMTAWMEKVPDGVPSIVHIRPGESKADAYVADTTFDTETNVLTWVIKDSDIGNLEGEGVAQIWLEYYEDEEVTKRGKSVKVITKVTEAADDPSGEIPSAQETMLAEMTSLKNATVTAKGAAEDAQEAAEGSAEDAEAYAKGTRDGSAVESDDPAYHNNAKYYSEQAGDSATSAGNSATAAGTAKTGAETAEDNAEAWAKGTKNGTDVPDTDPAYHNNAKYYSEQAAAATASKANLTVVAPAFAQATANDAGSFVTYEGIVYLLPEGHTAGTTWANTTKTATNIGAQLASVKTAIHGLDEEINGGTEYTEETWSGTLEAGRYNKNGDYTATNDYRSATVDLTDVVSLKVTAEDAAGVGYALVVYENDNNVVVGSAFDCDGTRKVYIEQLVDNFPTGATKAIIVHFRNTYETPTIIVKKAVVVTGIADDVEGLKTSVTGLDGQINGGTSEVIVTWSGVCEHGRYSKNGNYTATNDYRSAIVDMTNVTEMIVSATDAKSTDYAVVIFKNAGGTVIGTALDCNGTERRTYENEVVSNIPANTATAIVVNFRLYIDDPVIKLKKRVETAGIEEDVNDLKALTSDKFTMQGKKIVCFGDSIFGMKTPPNDIPSYLEKYLGVTAYNCGFSGAWMADRQSQTGYNAFSLNHLIDSVVDGDFTEQENAFVITPDLPSTYRTNLTTLEGIDFSTVDIVTIAFGTNDFMSAIPYENQNDNHDVTTVFGSLRHCIEALLTEYPNIRIFVMGQTYRFWMDGQGAFDYDSNTYERGDHTKLTDMVELTKAVAKEYNLPFIDNYKDLGICQYNRTQYFPSNDGTHHNENGVILLARHIAHELY